MNPISYLQIDNINLLKRKIVSDALVEKRYDLNVTDRVHFHGGAGILGFIASTTIFNPAYIQQNLENPSSAGWLGSLIGAGIYLICDGILGRNANKREINDLEQTLSRLDKESK